jgi:ribonuclease G
MLRIKKEILINSQSEDEIRIAITEDDNLVELFIETPETERHVGDIYLGKLAKVIPGMNAAFVNVGLEQDAFLHFSDVGDSYESSAAYLSGEDVELKDEDDEEDDYLVEEGATAAEQKVIRPRNNNQGPRGRNTDRSYQDPEPSTGGRSLDLRLAGDRDQGVPALTFPAKRDGASNGGPQSGRDYGRNNRPIPTLLQANVNLESGQNILVQVTREAFANKGVRVTSRISLPGRFLVLVPFEPGIGISRKVYSVRERSRLRRVVRSLKPRELGVIIRTVAENKEESALREDLQKLLTQWADIEKKIREGKAPMLVCQDQSLTSSVMRDLFTPDVSRIVIDSKRMYKEVMDYVEWAAPNLTGTVEMYRGQKPLFDEFDIEQQIEQTLTRKIPLPSGGYLFVEHTEAMVVIDVNSGRYAARREQELNSLKTNLESAREIARQLRLRDIGGIIVVDFIDMQDERNKKKVYDEMKKEFRKDRAKSSILPLTEFGIMQITRQRIRQSIVQSLSEACPVCAGTGLLVSKTTILKQIERWLERFRAESRERKLILSAHSSLAEMLQRGMMSPLRSLQLHYLVRLKVDKDDSLTGDDFHFFSPKQQKDITEQYSSAAGAHLRVHLHDHDDDLDGAETTGEDISEEQHVEMPELRRKQSNEGGRPQQKQRQQGGQRRR